jgi:diguanylate cyclase (GGDEF)-like protein
LVEPRDVVTIRPSASLKQAVELMQQRSVGCLVVMDEAGALKGILSERDVVTRGLGNGRSLDAITVGQAMTADVVCCEVGTPLDKIQRIMTVRRIRHLPLVRDGALVGMASSRDVMVRQIEQDRSMRMAAEQAATLSSSLQSLDLGDVVEMVTRHVPMIFGAKRCVLHLPGGRDMPVGPLIDRHQCVCAPQDLPGLAEAGKGEKATVAPVAPSCAAAVEGHFRMVIPLLMRGAEQGAGKLLGRLCLCDLADEAAGSLLEYKGALVRNILEANLTSAVRHEDLMRRTLIDPLTGVGTRMPFERRLEEECSRAARHDCPFCLAMVDVDQFKSVNDNLGHAGGDKALTLVGACMGRNKRTSDVLARFGGDEFVLLLPETELEGGFIVLERIRKQIEGMLVAEGVAMTISAGIVDSRSCPGASANEMLRRADMALYRAKEAGRNKTESWANLAKDPSAISEDEGQEIAELREKLADISSRAKEAFIQSIGGLVRALDARDPYTKRHSENTMRYAVSIAESLGLPDEEVAVIRRAAVIHDLGKIGVCDSVLLCPRKLTPNELRIMQQHPVIAGRILDQMHFLERELPIVRHHHERWDGQGYPDGLAGTAIPLGARILAVADSFDAITSTRVYRDAKSVPESLQILADNAGTQFDRTVVEAMLKWADSVHSRIGRGDKPLLTSDLLEAQLECVLGA